MRVVIIESSPQGRDGKIIRDPDTKGALPAVSTPGSDLAS